MTRTNVGRWDYAYKHAKKGELLRYSNDDVTYQLGYNFLKDCSLIEDWGCGYTYFSKFCNPGQYIGIDGSCSPNADKQVDLCTYTSNVPAIFMRHVLEHNEEWEKVLRNALSSFKEKMVLVLFTPFVEKTYDSEPLESGTEHRCYFFKQEDITRVIREYGYYELKEGIRTETQFRVEHVFFIEKDRA